MTDRLKEIEGKLKFFRDFPGSLASLVLTADDGEYLLERLREAEELLKHRTDKDADYKIAKHWEKYK